MKSSDNGKDDLQEVEAALANAERRGLKLAITGRTLALVPFFLWLVIAGSWPSNVLGGTIVGVFIALGVLHYFLIGGRRERWWHRYAFMTIDVLALASLAAFMPLSIGGDVPQIIAFRAYGTTYLFLVLAVAALSLSPGLVMWTGLVCVAGLWAAFGWVVAGMERTLSWGDLPPGPSGEQYLEVFLDPDFIGIGNRIEESLFILLSAAILALAVRRARAVVRDRALAERRRAEIASVFGRYVPQETVDALVAERGALAPTTRTATVLFIDIEGFTRLSERKQPADVIPMLNAYFNRVAQVVGKARGVVISYVGDAVLAVFNAPLANDDHARCAVTAAREILAMTGNERFEGERLSLRIGIVTGAVAAGSVGGGDRLAYTVYGDAVNLAQRVEQLNKQLGTSLLVSAATWEAMGRDPSLQPVGELPVRGRTEAVAVYADAGSVQGIAQAD